MGLLLVQTIEDTLCDKCRESFSEENRRMTLKKNNGDLFYYCNNCGAKKWLGGVLPRSERIDIVSYLTDAMHTEGLGVGTQGFSASAKYYTFSMHKQYSLRKLRSVLKNICETDSFLSKYAGQLKIVMATNDKSYFHLIFDKDIGV